jgi:hypothetical protein
MPKQYFLLRSFSVSTLAALALLLGLSGCKAVYLTQEGELFSAPATPPADLGLLYVYRLTPDKTPDLTRRVRAGQGISGPIPVMVQDRAVGELLYNGYLVLPLAPGEHQITIDKDGLPAAPGTVDCEELGKEGPLIVNVEAGAATFVQLYAVWETRTYTIHHSGQLGAGAGGFPGETTILKRIGIAVCFDEMEEEAALDNLMVARQAAGAE